ncbi:PC4-domain-containing protein [Setomelanomma holmii]|uniref:PC4-domain-containing protein n=1 Tax=Setomelanomma holmii TaxID=210430 RepID=A0A9P4LPN1_9PLEO|nr:PC4-domain-containing protein [Setomelanomma holmii]
MAGFKRGGGSFKRGFSKKRAGSDDDDSTSRTSKKSKGDDEEADSTPVVPELKVDDEGNKYVGLNASGLRRVTISDFKGQTFVNIREYWTKDGSVPKPSAKGLTLNIDQYNTLLGSIPLIESALAEKDIQVARPDFDADLSSAVKTPKDKDERKDVDEVEETAISKVDEEEDEG